MTKTELPGGAALIIEIERNMWETWSNYGRGPGCALHDEEDAIWFETPMPIIPYNGVLRFQVSENAHSRIENIVEHFKRRNVAFMWVVHPGPSIASRHRSPEGCR
jgi:hypothetical protein